MQKVIKGLIAKKKKVIKANWRDKLSKDQWLSNPIDMSLLSSYVVCNYFLQVGVWFGG